MLSTVEIIGSVFYAKYHAKKNKVKQALFISAPGAPQNISYQQTFLKNNQIDKITNHVLKSLNINFKTYDFRKGVIGNDEIVYDNIKMSKIPLSTNHLKDNYYYLEISY